MHPLDPLTAGEIIAAAKLIRTRNQGKGVHFKNITLIEPPKKDLRKFLAAERNGTTSPITLARRASALYYQKEGETLTADLFVATVDLGASAIGHVEKLDTRYYGQADMDEVVEVRDKCLSHPKVIERITKYRLPENLEVVCDTWPYGRDSDELNGRLAQCFLYAKDRSHPGSNAYDNPLPFSPIIDYITKELVDIVELPIGSDHALTPDAEYIPHPAKEWHHDLQSEPKRTDLKPLTVHQPAGASFTVDGHLVTWQKWRFRVGFNWREGMVLHDVTYDGRELFHRLSLSEMFVPYGDPRSPYSRKSVFDVGDIGAGVAANNLALGCDCLGLIKYFSFTLSDSNGKPVHKPNAICMHEIDDGIGWKHTDSATKTISIVRSRVLVLQTIITVGNYDYIFNWNLDQAAALHYRIQATGILSTVPIAPGASVPWGVNVNHGVMAPYHQHVFSLRIDPALDGDKNSFVEEDSVAMPFDENNPVGVGYITEKRVLSTSGYSEAQPNRAHKIINPSVINKVSGRPVAYAIHSPQKQMLLAHPESWHGKRAKFALQPYWVTTHRDNELYASGEYTYQSLPDDVPGGNDAQKKGDLGTWAGRGDRVDNEDIVLWHSISLNHIVRVEDYPVMPCETMTVSLKPSGFFEQNPALDVPQSTQRVNQSVLYEERQRSCCEPKL
ncbi:copper amine oxidase [Dactylonectria estremocensis]|uniref:Amine oxidase n=1 Tax=Dactylonectria estremocensis TaxID=1079267 RepID=A0A9P9IP81_9HYPO|nr:copper amine oxidase [Dactylonectria estremocensis]